LDELREAHARLGAELKRVESTALLSETYDDALAQLYTQLTLWECLARDLKAEMDCLTDHLPED
jgi:hypothetical protein